jgi:hypothetical protein
MVSDHRSHRDECQSRTITITRTRIFDRDREAVTLTRCDITYERAVKRWAQDARAGSASHEGLMITSVAAIVFTVVTSLAAGFQFGLALGAPWGAYAMGGRFPGAFPPLMRVAAFLQAVLLVLMVLIVLSRAGFVFPQWAAVSALAVWVVVVVSAVALVLNTMTPSRDERRIWAPVSGVMFVCSLVVALTRARTPLGH